MASVNKTISSCRNSDVAPSNTRHSEQHLIDIKKVELRESVQLEDPSDLAVVCQKLVETVSGPVQGRLDLKPISDVLNEEHAREEHFDEGLFRGLREFLSRRGLVQIIEVPVIAPEATMAAASPTTTTTTTTTPAAATRRNGPKKSTPTKKQTATITRKAERERAAAAKAQAEAQAKAEAEAKEKLLALELGPIVFNYGLDDTRTDYPMYAIGFARQSNGEQRPASSSGLDSRKPQHQRTSGSSDSTSSGVAAGCRLDHCSCLLERTEVGGEWKVLRTFSVVELKALSNNECAFVSVDHDDLQSVDITSAHGAIAQALMYTLAWALPSHAEVNELEDLSWAAIIGKKKPNVRNESKIAAIKEETEEEGDWEETENETAQGNDEKKSQSDARK